MADSDSSPVPPNSTPPEQPPAKPLDVDGVSAAITGTILFVVGLVVLLFFRGRLAENDATWWLWVFVAGAILGVVGIWYTTRRRAAYRAAGHQTY